MAIVVVVFIRVLELVVGIVEVVVVLVAEVVV